MKERVPSASPFFTREGEFWVLGGERVDIFRESNHRRMDDFIGFACPQNDWFYRGEATDIAAAYSEFREHVSVHIAGHNEEQVDTHLEYVYMANPHLR